MSSTLTGQEEILRGKECKSAGMSPITSNRSDLHRIPYMNSFSTPLSYLEIFQEQIQVQDICAPTIYFRNGQSRAMADGNIADEVMTSFF